MTDKKTMLLKNELQQAKLLTAMPATDTKDTVMMQITLRIRPVCVTKVEKQQLSVKSQPSQLTTCMWNSIGGLA